MTRTYSQIQAQIAKLQTEADKIRRSEVAGVIARMKEAIAAYELKPGDLFGPNGAVTTKTHAKPGATKKAATKRSVNGAKHGKGTKVPVKYRDPDGNTWTGRGNQPRWLRAAIEAGKQLESFRV